jgi:DNA recombination protein Rad52
MFTEKQLEALNAKLDQKHVQPPQQYGPKGHYLEGWHVIAEANRIFGFDGWSYETVDTKCVSEAPRKIGKAQKDGWGVTYTSRVRVTVHGIVREDFGAGHGYDVDAGLAHESAVKEAVTDALKRALRTFGNPFGLALYDKSRANVEPVEQQRTAVQQAEQQRPSAASMKRGLEEIERELLDCHSTVAVETCAATWRHILKRDGWTKDYIAAAGDKFNARKAVLAQSQAEDVFPGDLTNSHQRPLEMQ